MKHANGPLSPLHYALHSQLYLWKTSNQCAANSCRKPILQHFMAVLWESDHIVSKQSHFVIHFIHPQGVRERTFSKLKMTGKQWEEWWGTEVNNAACSCWFSTKVKSQAVVGASCSPILQRRDVRIFQVHSLFKFGTWTVKKIPIVYGHTMVHIL